MDDTPRDFLQELKTSVLKKRVGQIALAVVLAQAVWRLISALTWYVLLPLVGRVLDGHTESVLFETKRPFPVEQFTGSLTEFGLTLIAVFYLNRWIHGKPLPPRVPEPDPAVRDSREATPEPSIAYNLVGEPVSTDTDCDD